MRCTPGAVLARPLHDLKDPNEFEPREQDQAAQTAGLARAAPIGMPRPSDKGDATLVRRHASCQVSRFSDGAQNWNLLLCGISFSAALSHGRFTVWLGCYWRT